METGDATSLETNKIAVESISARTAADLNRAELQAKIQQLNTMTGDSDDSFEDVTYPPVETLPPADVLSEVQIKDKEEKLRIYTTRPDLLFRVTLHGSISGTSISG